MDGGDILHFMTTDRTNYQRKYQAARRARRNLKNISVEVTDDERESVHAQALAERKSLRGFVRTKLNLKEEMDE